LLWLGRTFNNLLPLPEGEGIFSVYIYFI